MTEGVLPCCNPSNDTRACYLVDAAAQQPGPQVGGCCKASGLFFNNLVCNPSYRLRCALVPAL